MAETARGSVQPKVCQLSVFLENRVGLLLKLSKQLEHQKVHICAISIVDTADVAIVRLVVDNVPAAKTALSSLTVYETELVGVELPVEQGIGITSVLGTLLRAEINVHYAYPLIMRSSGNPVLVLHVDEHETAVRILQSHGLSLIGQDDIVWEGAEGS